LYRPALAGARLALPLHERAAEHSACSVYDFSLYLSFTLDPDKMLLTRYSAEDPVYFKGQFTGSDAIGVADLPYKPDKCEEKGFLDYSKDAKR
jgi:hypothetical protein